jgi:hypothetical protein
MPDSTLSIMPFHPHFALVTFGRRFEINIANGPILMAVQHPVHPGEGAPSLTATAMGALMATPQDNALAHVPAKRHRAEV